MKLKDITNVSQIRDYLIHKKLDKQICEVGCFDGFHLSTLITENTNLAVGIDPWEYVGSWADWDDISSSPYIRDGDDINIMDYDYDHVHEVAKNRFKGNNNVKLIKATSREAIQQFDVNLFDFVYIDASNFLLDFTFDLFNWYDRVVPGGIIGGYNFNDTLQSNNNYIVSISSVVRSFLSRKGLSVVDLHVCEPIIKDSVEVTTSAWFFHKKI